MQVITIDEGRGRFSVGSGVVRAMVVGTVLIASSGLLAWLAFGTGVLERFTPSGRASTGQFVIGVVAWTFALIAPAAFGIIGMVRVGTAVERIAGGRTRLTPAYRLRAGLPDDHAIATRVRLPDGSRVIPELVIGPFGAAVIEELPPAAAVVSRGPRSWDVRLADGRVQMIDHPLERATRDAERVRAWFSGAEEEHVVKVYAAVVGADPNVERSPTCAYISADQVGPWLASLPPQRSFDTDRRDRVIRLVRSAL